MFTKTKALSLAERVAAHDDAAARALDTFTQVMVSLEAAAAGLEEVAYEARAEANRLAAFADHAVMQQRAYSTAASKIRGLTGPDPV